MDRLTFWHFDISHGIWLIFCLFLSAHKTIASDRANLIGFVFHLHSRTHTLICLFTFVITLSLSSTLVNKIFVDNFRFYSVPFNISYQHFELIKFNANTCYALIQNYYFFSLLLYYCWINFHSKCITMPVIQLQFCILRLWVYSSNLTFDRIDGNEKEM